MAMRIDYGMLGFCIKYGYNHQVSTTLIKVEEANIRLFIICCSQSYLSSEFNLGRENYNVEQFTENNEGKRTYS
jgi:hypothetical protein